MGINIEDLKKCATDLAKMPKGSDRIVTAFIYGLKVGAETKEEATEANG